MKSDNFENIIKEKIQNVEIEPPKEVWEGIVKKLFIKSIIKILLFITLFISILAGVIVFSFNKSDKKITFIAHNSNFNKITYRTNNDIEESLEPKNNSNKTNYNIVVVRNDKKSNNDFFIINSLTNNYIQNNQIISPKWSIDNKITNKDDKNIENNQNNKVLNSIIAIPKAIFEYSMPIYSKSNTKFISKCENATNYKWFVNYELKSTDSVFEFSFPKADIYIVTLIASNSSGTNDTISESIVALEPDKYIVFPNAFCPNTNGASGGYYTENMADNSIFRPFVFSKVVVQYKLTILNRAGQIIYTSQDFYKGWDGYYNNKIVPVGVYLFVAEGKFDDGQIFKEAGSITVLY